MGEPLEWIQLIAIIIGFAGLIKTFGVKEGRQVEKNKSLAAGIKKNETAIEKSNETVEAIVKNIASINESLSYIKGQLVGGNVIKK